MPTVDRGDTRIVWDESGAGEPLLLIMGHGWPRQSWHRQVPVLSTQFRVLTFDNRGAGETTTTAAHWTLTDMAEDAIAVLDAAHVDRAHVFGVSMGGGIAQEVALTHPERVGALVLGCTASAAADRAVSWGTLLGHVLPALPRGKRAAQFALLEVLCYGPGADPARIGEDLDVIRSAPRTRAGLRGQREAIRGFHSASRLPALTAPTLVLHGDADRLVPPRYGEELARLIPGAELVLFAGAGHAFTTDATDATNDAVARFLTAHALSGP